MGVSTGDKYKIIKAKQVTNIGGAKAPKFIKVKVDDIVMRLKYGATYYADDNLSEPMQEISSQMYIQSNMLEVLIDLLGTSVIKKINSKKD